MQACLGKENLIKLLLMGKCAYPESVQHFRVKTLLDIFHGGWRMAYPPNYPSIFGREFERRYRIRDRTVNNWWV